MIRIISLLLLLPTLAVAVPIQESRYLMGTVLKIVLDVPSQTRGREILENSFAIVDRVEQSLSNYRESSEISRFNRGEEFVPTAIFRDFLIGARALRERTGGAFNPAIRPVVELWREAERRGVLPSDREIRLALRCVEQWPEINYDGRVFSPCTGLKLESGGYGKGYAVDLVVRHLRDVGVKSALVDFGTSSVYALGRAPGGEPWRLQVRFGEAPPLGELEAEDIAISGSDTLGGSFKIAELIFGHIINPKTGMPEHKRRQVVVATSTAAEAEGLCKAILLTTKVGELSVSTAPLLEGVYWQLLNDNEGPRENTVAVPGGRTLRWYGAGSGQLD